APPLPGSKDVVHHGAGPSILGATTGPRRLSPAGSGISGHTVSSKHPGIDLNTLKHAPPVPVAHVLRRGNKLMPAAGPNWNLPWVNSGYGYASGYAWAGKLWVQHPNGAWGTCSASVVGYRLLATAAHCVRDHDTGQWNTAYLFE